MTAQYSQKNEQQCMCYAKLYQKFRINQEILNYNAIYFLWIEWLYHKIDYLYNLITCG